MRRTVYIAADEYTPDMGTYKNLVVVPVRCPACSSGKTYPHPAQDGKPAMWECLECRGYLWSMAEKVSPY